MGHFFGVRLLDKEDIIASFTLIGVVTINFVILLLPFWSTKMKSSMHFSSNSQLQGSTHVFIKIYDKKQNRRTNGITELIEKEGRYFIEFRKKPFEYNEDKKQF